MEKLHIEIGCGTRGGRDADGSGRRGMPAQGSRNPTAPHIVMDPRCRKSRRMYDPGRSCRKRAPPLPRMPGNVRRPCRDEGHPSRVISTSSLSCSGNIASPEVRGVCPCPFAHLSRKGKKTGTRTTHQIVQRPRFGASAAPNTRTSPVGTSAARRTHESRRCRRNPPPKKPH